MRPVDLARKLNISTATLRHYETMGMFPPPDRSASGHRIFTLEHLAYLTCIREMMLSFTLTDITKMLKPVMDRHTDEALWMAVRALTAIQNDKYTCGQMKQRFLKKKRLAAEKEYTIDAVGKITGIPLSTIRYWDKIGLISTHRSDNNYRKFTAENIDQILTVAAFKLSMAARGEKYAVEQLREEMEQFDSGDTDKIAVTIAGIEKHLATLNRNMIRSIHALYCLCEQVDQNSYQI